ncbi:hypothetical protein [Actinomadura hibisca]|uniref:hypothetical protein n=1 Tax=Actinomadura hibisca TaxID=68565 RepID=UPI00082F809C|nr:hypothetical protein [Actinomadura hibisca]
MNRRGNGLSADAYAPLADLEPRLADAVLAALREAGVAAYAAGAEPPEDDLSGLLAGVADPADDDLERVYVDAAMRPTAEGVLRAQLTRLSDADLPPADPRDQGPDDTPTGPRATGPHGADPGADPNGTDPGGGPQPKAGPDTADPPGGGPAELDEDAIWAEIVAGYDTTHEGDRVPWPDQENIHEPEDPPREGDDRTGRFRSARVVKAADDDTDDYPPPADDEGHYVPPPPPPLPAADPLTKGAWLALVGGPLYLLVTVILDWDVPGYAAFLAVAAFIGGFVTLVLRMGDEPRGPDDGAVV